MKTSKPLSLLSSLLTALAVLSGSIAAPPAVPPLLLCPHRPHGAGGVCGAYPGADPPGL